MAPWRFDLNEDEDLVVDQRPHWSMLAPPLIQLIVLVVLATLGIVLLSFMAYWTIFIPLVLFLFLLVRLVLRLAKYRGSHLIVSTERLIYISGVIGRRVQEIPISQISNLSFRQTLFERLFGFGSLEVDHAGEDGRVLIRLVRRPQLIVRLLSSQMSRRLTAGDAVKSFSPVDQLAKLAELRRAGSITDVEYESAKSKLLDQI
ncbi:MAG: PH domain-containing protein [Acidimicrobiaceae bacterium]|nr:PH domain-containing protein [Acidimicrobiaceae bacterium]